MGPVVGVEEGGVEVEEGGMMVKVRIGRVEGRRGDPHLAQWAPSPPSKVIISRNPLRPSYHVTNITWPPDASWIEFIEIMDL